METITYWHEAINSNPKLVENQNGPGSTILMYQKLWSYYNVTYLQYQDNLNMCNVNNAFFGLQIVNSVNL